MGKILAFVLMDRGPTNGLLLLASNQGGIGSVYRIESHLYQIDNEMFQATYSSIPARNLSPPFLI